ncbi:MAG: LPS assembly protein LptD [Thermodesulfobacteriota bacterium]|nr:LPS assembly protein LptD [Thermodesulfobacteriota bacterium]
MVFRRYLLALALVVALCRCWGSLGSLCLGGEETLPYRLKADRVTYNDATKTYRAEGQVIISRGDQSLHADAVGFSDETKEVTASGGVRLVSGGDWLTGSRVEANLETGIGTVHDGILFMEESHFYVGGDEIKKTGRDSYYVRDARFTTCHGESADWEITGKDLRVTVEGYGKVKHAAFRARSIPVLYVPFLVFPAKRTRQTGLLVPEMGYSKDRGLEVTQPFFWAIGESSDATFYEHYMARRGLKQGLEYRYVVAPASKGIVMSDFLWDREIDENRGAKDSPIAGFEGFGGDSEDRTNRDRWWLRLKSDHALPGEFKAKLDLDVVSDQDYLREFYRGYSGYKDSNTYFLEEFGRGLEDRTETVRRNQLNVNRTGAQYVLNGDMIWYDDVITRRDHDPDPTLQMLPRIQFASARQKLYGSPLQLHVASSYDYLWRDDGTKGHRADLYPRFHYPTTLLRWLDVEPSFGARQTLWQIEDYGGGGPGRKEQFHSRTLCDFKADVSTELSKVFPLKGRSSHKMRHVIRPRVVYQYAPVSEDEDYPYFQGVDTVADKHLVTYSVTTCFATKTAEALSSAVDVDRLGDPSRFHDLCRIKVTQSYDILEARGQKNSGKRRPFSDIEGEVECSLSRHIDLNADVAWSPYDSRFKSHNVLLTLTNRRGDAAALDYRYTKGGTRTVVAEVDLKVSDPMSAYCELERDLRAGQSVEALVGLRYEAQCWSLDIGVAHDRALDSEECFFKISLYGLGKAGG